MAMVPGGKYAAPAVVTTRYTTIPSGAEGVSVYVSAGLLTSPATVHVCPAIFRCTWYASAPFAAFQVTVTLVPVAVAPTPVGALGTGTTTAIFVSADPHRLSTRAQKRAARRRWSYRVGTRGRSRAFGRRSLSCTLLVRCVVKGRVYFVPLVEQTGTAGGHGERCS